MLGRLDSDPFDSHHRRIGAGLRRLTRWNDGWDLYRVSLPALRHLSALAGTFLGSVDAIEMLQSRLSERQEAMIRDNDRLLIYLVGGMEKIFAKVASDIEKIAMAGSRD